MCVWWRAFGVEIIQPQPHSSAVLLKGELSWLCLVNRDDISKLVLFLLCRKSNHSVYPLLALQPYREVIWFSCLSCIGPYLFDNIFFVRPLWRKIVWVLSRVMQNPYSLFAVTHYSESKENVFDEKKKQGFFFFFWFLSFWSYVLSQLLLLKFFIFCLPESVSCYLAYEQGESQPFLGRTYSDFHHAVDESTFCSVCWHCYRVWSLELEEIPGCPLNFLCLLWLCSSNYILLGLFICISDSDWWADCVLKIETTEPCCLVFPLPVLS